MFKRILIFSVLREEDIKKRKERKKRNFQAFVWYNGIFQEISLLLLSSPRRFFMLYSMKDVKKKCIYTSAISRRRRMVDLEAAAAGVL